jgi:mannitol/fructose-specific phosphotransferase system IIA component (Ntr-type)
MVMTIAALLAFFSVANAGILGASRYPLAMSRDRLMPATFNRLGRFGTPTLSIWLTVGLVIICVTTFNPLNIAKLAGAFQLLLFAFNCLAVIVMRESRIDSYDPGFRSPWYPWAHIAGIVAPIALIIAMGWLPMVFSAGLIAIGLIWYARYAHHRVERHGAIYHVFERLGRRRFDDLDRELRGILKEKGLREEDPFVETVARAVVIDADPGRSFEDIVDEASDRLAPRVDRSPDELASGFLEGTRIGATPVAGGTALPHLRLPGIEAPSMVLVRCRGVRIAQADSLGKSRDAAATHAIFFLVSPEADAGQHLRLLAELASRVDQEDFLDQWRKAGDGQQMKETLLRHERYMLLAIAPDTPTGGLVDHEIRAVDLPRGCLVAVVRRKGETIVPGGDTVLRTGDQMAIIGSEKAIRECGRRFGGKAAD